MNKKVAPLLNSAYWEALIEQKIEQLRVDKQQWLKNDGKEEIKLNFDWKGLENIRFNQTTGGKSYSLHPVDFIAWKLIQEWNNYHHLRNWGLFSQAMVLALKPGAKQLTAEKVDSPTEERRHDGFLFDCLANIRYRTPFMTKPQGVLAHQLRARDEAKNGEEVWQIIKDYDYWLPLLNEVLAKDIVARQAIFHNMQNRTFDKYHTIKSVRPHHSQMLSLWTQNKKCRLGREQWEEMWGLVFKHQPLATIWGRYWQMSSKPLPLTDCATINQQQFIRWVKDLHELEKGGGGEQKIEFIKNNALKWIEQEITLKLTKEDKKWFNYRRKTSSNLVTKQLNSFVQKELMAQTLPEASEKACRSKQRPPKARL